MKNYVVFHGQKIDLKSKLVFPELETMETHLDEGNKKIVITMNGKKSNYAIYAFFCDHTDHLTWCKQSKRMIVSMKENWVDSCKLVVSPEVSDNIRKKIKPKHSVMICDILQENDLRYFAEMFEAMKNG
jgi:hypothetical protein